jgi:molybdopterin converting factor small subunit
VSSKTVATRLVLPDQLRELAGGRRALELEGPHATVRDVLAALKEEHGAVHDRIVTERGEVRTHVNVFVGREDIRHTGGLDTPVADGAEIFVIPSVSGG